MPRSTTDRVALGRSIRGHVLNWQDHRNAGSTTAGARRELKAAFSELLIAMKLEGIEIAVEEPAQRLSHADQP